MQNEHDSKYELERLRTKIGEEKFDNRLEDFKNWIVVFKEKRGKHFACKNKSNYSDLQLAVFLNFQYWSWIEDFVRVHIDGKHEESKDGKSVVQHYKIASTKEFIICKYQPFVNANDTEDIRANAAFARSVMMNVVFGWNSISNSDSNIETKRSSDELKKFLIEHTVWLEHFAGAQQISIFSNSQTLRLFHYWLKDHAASHEFNEFEIAD